MSDEDSKEQDLKMDQSEIPDENLSKILDSQEINNAEHDVIKGDTIGETLYSAKWILNTLISLSKVYEEDWNESLENDLCMLWDMTAENDIVEFLLENDFLKMAEFTLKISEQPRLTEIIVGIIGNMCCNTKSLEALTNMNELNSLIFNLTSSDDKETLIQVFRILQAALWDIKKNPKSLWLKKILECQILRESVTFILKSSTSEELLTPCIDFVYLMSDLKEPSHFLESVFDIDQLIYALCESMIELINQKENCHSNVQLKNIENWFNILFNIMKQNLLKFSDGEDENFNKINAVILKILQPYEDLSNIMPLENESIICIHQCIQILLSFQKNEMFPSKELIQSVLKVMINLEKAATEDDFENTDDLKELYEYLVNYWSETLRNTDTQKILELLQLCDQQTVNNIKQLTAVSKIPSDCIAKLQEALSMLTPT